MQHRGLSEFEQMGSHVAFESENAFAQSKCQQSSRWMLSQCMFCTWLLPAGLRVAQHACRCCSGPKVGFLHVRATHYSDKREICLSGQKCGNTAPKTVKIWNSTHKFVPRARLLVAQFLRNSQRFYASLGCF